MSDVEHAEHNGSDDSDIIWVTDFTEEAAREFADKLFKASVQDPKKPLIVYIDSYGGLITALLAMIAAIDAVPNQVVTVCMGKASSAGAVLLSHGDIRYVSKLGRVMVHEALGGAIGQIHDAKIDIMELEHQNDSLMGLLADNCSMSKEQLLGRFTNKQRDIHMSAGEALAFGIADKIGVPKVKKLVRYEIE
jgi:ATP-dependent Clp protease protease subunit